MHRMNQGNFDLNLLRVFQAVFLCGNVRRAAERLGMSQPAVSHGLTRLRLQLKDPLFVRAPGGVAPTSRAQHFARSVDLALATVEASLNEADRFDPLVSERRFTLHVTDLGQGEFLPGLMAHLHGQAPHLRIDAVQLPPDDVLPALEQGRIDLALGHLPHLRGTEHEHLATDHYVLALRAGHPKTTRPARPVELHELEFIDVASHPQPRRALAQAGLAAQVRLTLPQFSTVPEVLIRTDLAAIVPDRAAQRFARHHALTLVPLALDLPAMEVWSHWYWRQQHDPGHRWLREALVHLYADTEANTVVEAEFRRGGV